MGHTYTTKLLFSEFSGLTQQPAFNLATQLDMETQLSIHSTDLHREGPGEASPY